MANVVQSLFCVYDSKAEHYLPPFHSHNNQTAIRQFGNAVLDEGHEFCRNAADFSLHFIGTFDSLTGQIEFKSPALLATAQQVQAQAVQPRMEALQGGE